ncbi:MAG: helix-turn-helix domain-containing protein [Christensenellales bacterium]|jgi:AraC-like DNA-binding protein/quercetin dioxygenase-like cupin family protein
MPEASRRSDPFIAHIRDYVAPGEPEISVHKMKHGAVSLHGHAFFEIAFIQKGFCLHETNGHTMLITAGDLLLIRPGEKHRYISNHDIALYNCLFTPEALGGELWQSLAALDEIGLFRPASAEKFPFRAHLSLAQQSAIHARLEEMLLLIKEKARGWELSVSCLLGVLLAQTLRIFRDQYSDAAEGRAYVSYVAQALRYMDDHYAEDITVSALARSVGISADYFTRQFKQVMGVTPVDYLRRFRLARSMELLRSDIAISKAASAVGFKNLCHFSREFKKHLGLTPSEYRNQQKNKA